MSLAVASVLQTGTQPAVRPYRTYGVVFDGTNDWLTRGAGLTGAVDNKTGLISFWVKLTGGDGTLRIVAQDDDAAPRFMAEFQADNTFRVRAWNAAGSLIVRMHSSVTFTADGLWHHIIASFATASGGLLMYVDGVSARSASSTILTNDTVDWTTNNFAIGAQPDGTNKLPAEIADFYFDNIFVDLTVVGQLRRFIADTLRPAIPVGPSAVAMSFPPLVEFRGPASLWAVNNGDGGNFTINGALTDASTTPSIP